MKDGTGEKGVVFVNRGEVAMWATTVEVWKVGGAGGVEMVSREGAVLTSETKEGGGPREGGVNPETQDCCEKTVVMKVCGKERGG